MEWICAAERAGNQPKTNPLKVKDKKVHPSAFSRGCKASLFLFLMTRKQPSISCYQSPSILKFSSNVGPFGTPRSDANLKTPFLNNSLDSSPPHLILKTKSTLPEIKYKIKQGSHPTQLPFGAPLKQPTPQPHPTRRGR